MTTIQSVLCTILSFTFTVTAQVKELKYKDQGQLHDIQQQITAKRIEQDIRKLVSFSW